MKIHITITFGCLLLSAISFAKNISTELAVTEKGFEPSSLSFSPGDVVTLKITRKTDSTCATAIQVPDKKIKVELPLNKVVEVKLGKLQKGEIKFGCGMNMMEGGIIHIK